MAKYKRICITPKVSGVGGMVSFRHKMTAGLKARGIEVTNDLNDGPYDAVLVIGGTKNLIGLWNARRKGIRIVQRLNGMNWLHRIRPTGMKHKFRAEVGNWILSTIRHYLTNAIIYQSKFAQMWWNREYGKQGKESTIIHNAVDLSIYTDDGPFNRPSTPYQILLVEGSLGGGYEVGLETAIDLVTTLREKKGLNVELTVAGKVSDALRKESDQKTPFEIQWKGLIPREEIPEIDRSAHLLYSADINGACPNSVIEALACGLPVAAFDTGALPELVNEKAGAVVPYGGNPWLLDPPDITALADAAEAVLLNNENYRIGARAHAEKMYGLDKMVENYLKVLLDEGASH